MPDMTAAAPAVVAKKPVAPAAAAAPPPARLMAAPMPAAMAGAAKPPAAGPALSLRSGFHRSVVLCRLKMEIRQCSGIRTNEKHRISYSLSRYYALLSAHSFQQTIFNAYLLEDTFDLYLGPGMPLDMAEESKMWT